MASKVVVKTFQYGDQTVTFETGKIARQASGAVLVNMEGTTVLVTVVGLKTAKPGQSFFPLTVVYQERMYAAGRIPGGFFKREGRPSEGETLISRLIDRPLRPLFPAGFLNEVQIVATVLSINPAINPDIPAMLGASAALAVSGIPFQGPIGGARVGYIDGEFVLNPTAEELAISDLDLVVAGTSTSVLMVESEAKELSEETMLAAVVFGHGHMQVAINAINELAQESGAIAWDWTPAPTDTVLEAAILAQYGERFEAQYQIPEKGRRQIGLAALREEITAAHPDADASAAMDAIESKIVRSRILAGEARIDGRDTETVRPITIETGLLERVHGMALFTRGETQALVIATLGTSRDSQVIDNPTGERKDTFMLHYNFPPYSVGETGQMGSPKRREIGHGRLARRAIQAVLPSQADFPYVIRVVSEITESNGSSSMATVCGASLALMDAGVPLKSPVAGIAMGLIKEGDRFAVLSDILGDEDHLGDMDFKVAGTANGVTALQMDIKITGITKDVMEVALHQAQKGRIGILKKMQAAVSGPRTEMSEFAPRVATFFINPAKIRDVIGKGGVTIRGLTEEFGASIDLTDEGQVSVVAPDQNAVEQIRARIELMTAEVEVGRIYEGPIVRLMDFGAFVTILPGRDGLVHISQISDVHIDNVADVLAVGQVVRVKVLEIDRQGRVRLSIKAVGEGDAPMDMDVVIENDDENVV